MRSLFKTIYIIYSPVLESGDCNIDQHSKKQGALSAEEEERRKLRLVPEKQSCQVGMAVFDDSSSEIRFWIVTPTKKHCLTLFQRTVTCFVQCYRNCAFI